MEKKIILNENQVERISNFLKNEPTLQEVYAHTKNTSKIVALNESNAKRLIDRHSENGYAIVSASRGFSDFNLDSENPQDVEKLANINKERTREMVSLIKERGFSYTLTYGGFIENQGTEDEENVYERSCIIYAKKNNGEDDVKGMYDLALEICRKYNQDSVLIKLPNEKPKYVTQDGETDMEFSGDMAFNDIAQTYFTDLHKNTEKKIKNGLRPTRFTFLECYIAPKPQCYSESHIRSLNGEIFLKK